jgi:hydrogenase maturation protein HypF
MGTPGMIAAFCHMTQREEEILRSPSAPILLLRRRPGGTIAPSVAPDASRLGFMVPYTPLHLLLLGQLGEPLVLTSANMSDDPIIYADDMDSLTRLSDAILTHDRPIHTFADDSVAAVVTDDLYMIRRSRGFIPLPINLSIETDRKIVALGAMLKATFTLLFRDRAVLSQYIGNADSPGTISAMRTLMNHYRKIYNFNPDLVAVDKHPDYPNRLLSRDFPDCRLVEIQHHRAHIGALMAETGETGPLLGVSLDGTGYGDDGTIWGGEFFLGGHRNMERFAHLDYQFLPSGERAIKEPWRHALSYLHAIYGDADPVHRFASRFGDRGAGVWETLKKKVAGIHTSSCGRLFDAVACLLGLGDVSSYDGELPSRLQTAAESGTRPQGAYEFKIVGGLPYRLDMVPALSELLVDGRPLEDKAYLFHATLAAAILEIARRAREEHGIEKVGLSGGVFQNILLLTMTKDILEGDGFVVLIHREVPANDGGVSLGQAFLAAGMEDV